MSCSNNCGTSCAHNCSTTSSGNCGGCGTACSTSCQTTASGQSCSGCGTLCASNCTGTCSAICASACDDGCSTSCSWDCNTTCSGTCISTCANDCAGTCSGSCSNTCTATCANSCNNDCQGTCTQACKNDCNNTCNNTCTGGCTGSCVGGCGGSCDGTCSGTCSGTCNNNCTSVCSIGTTYGTAKELIKNYGYTGKVWTVTLSPGRHKLEVWGAQGGYRSSSDYGGKGGYSVGYLTLTKDTNVYIYVGGSGNSVDSATNGIYNGGFNGGGKRSTYKGGGGATDIRIGQDSLLARVIVAGGGGSDGASNKHGMFGGGVNGGTSSESYGSGGYGGTQTGNSWQSSSSAQSNTASSTSDAYAGFGFGGNGVYYSSGYGGAGGGGWYGGSGAYPDGSGDDDRGGGGGSGYVYTGPTASNYPSGCLLNSSYYLTDAQTIGGDQSFISPTGESETGHTGNGYCRITSYKPNICFYSKVNSVIKPSVFVVKQNNKIYDNASGTINVSYTGAMQQINLPAGKYILECWGAQGGNYSNYYGGAGGYAKGTLTLASTTTLYVYIGGQGVGANGTYSNIIINGSTCSNFHLGGFNGGGAGYLSGSGGGGATDIRIGRDSLYARIIVAGGGGGAGVTSSSYNYTESNQTIYTAGCGGGEIGGDGLYNHINGDTSGYRCGYGATQTAPGGVWNYSTAPTGYGAGFGFGGISYYRGYSSGGGGGGWYGGGGAYDNDSDSDGRWGGGGSGYVYTSATAANYPSGNFVNSTYYLADTSLIAGINSMPSPSGGTELHGHQGNGYCKITRVSNAKAYVKVNGVWKEV